MKKFFHFNLFLISCLFLFSSPLWAASSSNQPIPDSIITAKVKAKIAMDPSLSVFKVSVMTQKGIVTLAGEVNSDTDASALIEIAESTHGVKDVKSNNLNIKNSNQPFTDTAITAKVKGTFIREKIFGKDVSPTIHVETNNGVVYLSGTVDSQLKITNAINLAKSVNGVKQVESRIKIK